MNKTLIAAVLCWIIGVTSWAYGLLHVNSISIISLVMMILAMIFGIASTILVSIGLRK